MKRKMLMVAAVPVLMVVGCSSYKPPITTAPVAKARLIGKDVEACWKGVIRYFSDNNIPIENLDHSSFFIKTRPILLQQAVGGTSLNGDAVALQCSPSPTFPPSWGCGTGRSWRPSTARG